ncbi:MerR family transcriptional regulator [Streptomyces sp. ICN441]|uniref:MerR family transcriptional regulator n=1 Tax=Streptomyces sp. ICN441 TaxID=2558286 RepID=UPI001F0E7516|nr:MerR family transcriptional regulator [Streptomyces sp. ICN441]
MTTAILPGVSRFSTGALARAGGVSVDAIRFYEREGLLPPAERTSGDHRRYPPEALERLDFIRIGRCLGLTLEEIKELADACDQAPDCPVTHAVELLRGRIANVERQLEDLAGLRDRLVHVVERMESHLGEDGFTADMVFPVSGTESAA